MRKLGAVLLALLAIGLLAVPTQARVNAPATDFGSPLKLTPDNGHGYEPAVYTDHFGNIFVTAHKENWQLPLAPDSRSATQTRSMSWDWYSSTNGKTWGDLPGLTPLSAENHDLGDEGDMAVDDAHHLYFVDTNVTDITFTRWTIGGRGKFTLDTHRPVLPAAQPVDDRPWITAHLNGHVFYFGNEGDKVTYPGGGQCSGTCGDANGAGRYTVYASYDGGQTFSTTGYTLKDSGWCRPAAAPHTKYVYAVCTNDGGANGLTSGTAKVGTIWAYVSADDGHTWNRYEVGSYSALDSTTSWPTVAIAPNGDLYALYVDATKLDRNNDPIGNRLLLFHSTDHGRTWSRQDITPKPGRYDYGWLSMSSDGRWLGLGIYYRPNNSSDWYVYGAKWRAGQIPELTSIDPKHEVQDKSCVEANGDLMGSAFGPDDSLSVVWTLNTLDQECGTATIRDIWYAHST